MAQLPPPLQNIVNGIGLLVAGVGGLAAFAVSMVRTPAGRFHCDRLPAARGLSTSAPHPICGEMQVVIFQHKLIYVPHLPGQPRGYSPRPLVGGRARPV